VSESRERAHTRYRIRLGGEVESKGQTIRGATFDISHGGCRFESSLPLPEGATVKVRLGVVVDDIREPDYPPLLTRATVRWSAPTESNEAHYSGLEFHDLNDEHGRWIDTIISRG
jgi:c-di-GMP-binding flagellar brake protein YcgR